MDWSEWTQIVGELNYLAIIVSTLAGGMALGSIWYSPSVFGKLWQKLTGLKDSDINKKDAYKGYIGATILTFISAWALAILEHLMTIVHWIEGLNFGLFVGLLLVSTSWLVNYLFEKRPLKLWKINAGYATFNLAIMSVILAVWR